MSKKEQIVGSLSLLADIICELPNDVSSKFRIEFRYFTAETLSELKAITDRLPRPLQPMMLYKPDIDALHGKLGEIEFTLFHRKVLGGMPQPPVEQDLSLLEDREGDDD